MAKDYYKLLDIEKDAPLALIKKAYRKLALQYHPDINKSDDAEETFKEISEAYSVLSDPGKRRRYDLLGTLPRSGMAEGSYWNEAIYAGMGFGRGWRRSGRCSNKRCNFNFCQRFSQETGQHISREGDNYICKIAVSPDVLARGSRCTFRLWDSSGVITIAVEIPPGCTAGARIIGAELTGLYSGKLIIEIA